MTILFRADGDSQTGLGHIMRSSTLMQMLMDDFDCKFLSKNATYFPYNDFEVTPSVIPFDYSLIEEVNEMLKITSPDAIVVLDGYQFDTDYQQQLKTAGFRVVCIDDILRYHFVADVVINHAGGIAATDYSAEGYTRFCLGPPYALVKPSFQRVSKSISSKTVLISLGGADPANATESILGSPAISEFTSINVVLGGANRYAHQIKERYYNHASINVHHNISSVAMHSLMNESSYAILSPSTVCYEYMSTTGVVFLCQIADNQEHIRKYFISEGLAFDIAQLGTLTSSQMQDSITRQQTIFDGKSSERLKRIFAGLNHTVSA